MQEAAKVNYIHMEKDLTREMQNPVEKAQQMVVAVAALKNPPNLVERVTKFHYPQIFAGDVVKVDIRRGNLVKQWKPCAGTVP